MAEHLLGNLYQIGGGDITHPLDGASYLIVDEEKQEHALVDCGSTLGFEELERQAKEVGVELGRIAVIYATHGHFDHVSGKAFLPDIPIYIHPGDIDAVQTRDPLRTATYLYPGAFFPELQSVYPLEDGQEAVIGSSSLSSIHTPGHSPGSSSFKFTTKDGTVLLAGDTLWGCYDDKLASDADKWGQSLDRLAKDTFDFVTYGHGVSYLVPSAMHHIENARSHFRKIIWASPDGKFHDPWASSWKQEVTLILPQAQEV